MQKLLTEDEVARLLRVSREAILKFKRDKLNPIPCLRVGRRYLYEECEVLEWARMDRVWELYDDTAAFDEYVLGTLEAYLVAASEIPAEGPPSHQ